MKKTLLNYSSFFFIFFLLSYSFSSQIHASHIPGANITYSCNPANPLEYTFTMTLFRKCPGTHPATMSSSYFTLTNDCGLANPVIPTFNQVGVAIDVNQLCNSVTSNCSGGTQPGVWKYTYEATITLPAHCNGWHLAYDLCCRDASSNLSGTSSNNMAMSTTLNTLNSPCNNSPIVTAAPIPYACINTNFNYCLTTFDPEGDSMTFHMLAPAGASQLPITHLAGFSPSQPLNNFTLDSLTGCINLNHPTTGNYVVAIMIKEWDSNGNLLSEIIHDFQIMVVNCTNTPPTNPIGGISNFSGTGSLTSSNTIAACFGDQVCFDVVFQDLVDVGNILTITTDGTTLLPGSTFSQTGTNPVTGTFCWTSQPGYLNDVITFIAQDDGCPVMGTTGFAVDFDITTGIFAGPDITICGAQTASLLGQGASAYTWTPTTGLSCTNCANPTASPATTTTYTVTGNLTGVCTNSDDIVVSVVPDFPLTMTPSSSTICANEVVQLNAGGPVSFGPFNYTWSPMNTLNDPSIGNPLAQPLSSTTYVATVTAANGCTKTGNIPVTVSGIGPTVTITPADTGICDGQPVQLISTSNVYPLTCALSTGCSGSSSSFDIGTGTSATSTYSPFYGSTSTTTNYSTRIQYIYTAAELNAMGYFGGTIQDIALYFSTSYTYQFDKVTIWMGCTSQEEFPSTAFVNTSSMSQVFGPTDNINPTNNGWHTFNILDYDWDGISNIIIQFCSEEDGAGNAGSESVRYTSTSPAFRCLRYTTSSTTINACTNTVGSRYTSRANMRFNICEQQVNSPVYNWVPSASLSNSNTSNPIASPSSTTAYVLNVTDGGSGCTGSGIANINVGSDFNLAVSGSNTNICYGSTTNLLATTTGVGSFTYNWSPAGSLSNANIANPIATPGSTTTYFVTVTNGACEKYDNITINVSGNPVSASTSDNNICPNSSVTLDVSAIPQTCGLNPGGCSGTSTNATIGTGSSSSSTYGPFYGSYQDARYQFLYTASELTTMGLSAGTITEIGFEIVTKNTSGAFNDFTIKMGCTNASALNTSSWQNTDGIVYGPVNYTSSLGWNTFILTTPFDWDGVSNVVIECCFDNSTIINADVHRYSTTGFISTIRNYSNTGGPGCNMTPLYSYTSRPNLQFKICQSSMPVGAIFQWGPGTTLSNTTLQSPSALPTVTTTYNVSVTDPLNPGCPSFGSVTVNVQDIGVSITPAGPVNMCVGDPPVNLNAQLMVNGVATSVGSGTCATSYDETFDATLIPAGWTSSNSTASSSVNAYWKYGGNPNYGMAGTVENTGNGGNFAWVDGSSPYPIVVTLTSPNYPVATYSSLSFYMKRAVYASITTYNDFTVDFFDGSIWHNAVFSHSTNTLASTWEQFTIPLTAYTITGPIQFRFNVDKNGTPSPFYDDVAIDDIELCEAIVGSGYTWSPSTGLSNPTLQNPIANPSTTTQYLVESQYTGCTVTNTIDFNVGTPSTTPTMTPMPGTYCPNTTMTLTAGGGTAGIGSTIEWYTGPGGTGTWLGSGNSLNITPTISGETYYIRREGGCNITSDDMVTINLKDYIYGLNGATTNTWCTDNAGWHHFFSGNEILLSLQGDLSAVPANFPQITIMDNGSFYQQTQGPFTASHCSSSYLTPGEERFEMERNWNVDFGGGTPTGSYNLRFYYEPSEKTIIENAAANWMTSYPICGYSYKYPYPLGFYWFKNTGSNYTAADYDGLHLAGTNGVTPNGINYDELTGITNFSGGTGAIILDPTILLSAEWLYFEGETNNNTNHLKWATESEKNTNYFNIQRSKDGINFHTIGAAVAQGTSSSTNEYTFDDNNPFTGVNYYRIELIDKNLDASFSNTILLNISDTNTDYIFYPNPTNDIVYYQYEANELENLKIEVLDVLGKKVFSFELTSIIGINNIPINLTNLPSGSYMVRVHNKIKATVHSQKVIKNKF